MNYPTYNLTIDQAVKISSDYQIPYDTRIKQEANFVLIGEQWSIEYDKKHRNLSELEKLANPRA